jgi:hypothetical protein
MPMLVFNTLPIPPKGDFGKAAIDVELVDAPVCLNRNLQTFYKFLSLFRYLHRKLNMVVKRCPQANFLDHWLRHIFRNRR